MIFWNALPFVSGNLVRVWELAFLPHLSSCAYCLINWSVNIRPYVHLYALAKCVLFKIQSVAISVSIMHWFLDCLFLTPQLHPNSTRTFFFFLVIVTIYIQPYHMCVFILWMITAVFAIILLAYNSNEITKHLQNKVFYFII